MSQMTFLYPEKLEPPHVLGVVAKGEILSRREIAARLGRTKCPTVVALIEELTRAGNFRRHEGLHTNGCTKYFYEVIT